MPSPMSPSPAGKRKRSPSPSTPKNPKSSSTTASNSVPASPAMASQDLYVQGTGLLREVVAAAKNDKKGATVDQRDGISLVTYHNVESPAYRAYDAWRCDLSEDDDPLLSVLTVTGREMLAREAKTIVTYYATLRSDDFTTTPYPALPVPTTNYPGMDGAVRYHHASTAIRMVASRIANPQGQQNYPRISRLTRGEHICNIQTVWGKSHVTVACAAPLGCSTKTNKDRWHLYVHM